MKFFVFLLLILVCSCQAREASPERDVSAGFVLPEEQPSIYHAGWISTELSERDAAMSPEDQAFYYTLMAGNSGTIVYVERQEEEWSRPEIASFSGEYSDLEPFFDPSSEGRRLYFASNRPLEQGGQPKDYDLWYVDMTPQGWGDPVNVGSPVNTEGHEFYPSVARSGALYFTGRRELSEGGEDIYRALPLESGYAEPENLGTAVNTERDEFNAFIDPDEQYILFSSFGRPDGLGGGDLYISRKNDDGEWLPAKNLGSPINSSALDYCPFVSADGTFWFSSRRQTDDAPSAGYDALVRKLRNPGNGAGDIYWMNSVVLEK